MNFEEVSYTTVKCLVSLWEMSSQCENSQQDGVYSKTASGINKLFSVSYINFALSNS